MMFSKIGRSTKKGMVPRMYAYATYPNDSAMIAYRTVHTGPKSHDGGAHEGLMSVWYHKYVFIMIYIGAPILLPRRKN